MSSHTSVRQEATTSIREGLLQSTVIITFFSLLHIVVWFLIQSILAAKFGAKMEMDAYLASTTVPTLITTVFLGSFGFTFVPVYIEYETRVGKDEAWKMASSFMNITFLALSVFAVVGIIGAHWLVRLTVPGFGGDKYLLMVDLVRILFPTIIFAGLAGVLSSVHWSQHRFIVPSIALVLNSVVILLCVLTFTTHIGIRSVAIGSLLGAIAQFLLLIPMTLKEKRYHFGFDFKHPGVMQIVKLMIPLSLSAIFYKATPLFERLIASTLPEGSISYLGYSSKIVTILTTITTSGISTSVFPLMARYAAESNIEKLRGTFSLAIRMIMLVVTPTAVGVAVLRVPIIQLLFERGAFTHQATQATALALLSYLGVLFGGAIGTVTAQGFYVLQDTGTVAKLGVVEIIAYSGLCTLLAKYFSFVGVAITMSLYHMACIVVYSLILRTQNRFGRIDGRHILKSFAKILTSALLSGFFAHSCTLLIGQHFNLVGIIGTAVIIGILIYILSITRIFRMEEAFWMQNALIKGLKDLLGSLRQEFSTVRR